MNVSRQLFLENFKEVYITSSNWRGINSQQYIVSDMDQYWPYIVNKCHGTLGELLQYLPRDLRISLALCFVFDVHSSWRSIHNLQMAPICTISLRRLGVGEDLQSDQSIRTAFLVAACETLNIFLEIEAMPMAWSIVVALPSAHSHKISRDTASSRKLCSGLYRLDSVLPGMRTDCHQNLQIWSSCLRADFLYEKFKESFNQIFVRIYNELLQPILATTCKGF